MTTMMERMERVLERVGDLPAVPEVVTDVLRLTDDPDVDMAEVSNVIQRDPALSAKILRVSNSPYYGMRQYVGTLKLALVILGVREIRNIVLGISVFDSLRNGEASMSMTNELLKHSFLVGALSKSLGTRLKLGLHGEDFISGLLHDIGKLVLVRQLGPAYLNLYRPAGGAGEELCRAERDAFGFTHADAAAALAFRWNFPQTLTDAIHLHHAEQDALLMSAKDPILAAVVRIANLAAREDFDAEGRSPEEIAEDPEAWDILMKSESSIKPEERCQVLSSLVKELKDSPTPAL